MNLATAASGGYILRETAVSAVINAAISVGFFLGVFGAADPVPVWGAGNYAFDFAPQSFAIGLMGTLVPGLLARRSLARSGRTAAPSVGRVLGRAVVHGAAALIVGGGLCALALWLGGGEALARAPAFALKVGYGAALGAFVTAATLRRMLR